MQTPYKKLKQNQDTPFYSALSGFKNNIEISNYFIDSLKVNPKDYIMKERKDDWSIQDYILKFTVNSYVKAKLRGNIAEMETLKRKFPNIEENSKKELEFIENLESMGVDFKNYNYKK